MSPHRTIAAISIVVCLVASSAAIPAAASSGYPAPHPLRSALHDLVDHPNGPPGVIVVVQRGQHRHVFRAGVANIASGARMRADMHMRIASTAKAYSGGVALSLVEDGVLALDDTIGELLPWAPRDWKRVTLAQALHHTSGLPDFSADTGFLNYLVAHLDDAPPPKRLLRFVFDEDLEFEPGSEYRYSNSDNIVVALMAAVSTGHRYERELAVQLLEPLGLNDTSLPRGVEMPLPFIHGYDREGNGTPVDISKLVAAGHAWASGGIVSTPADQNRFIREYVGRHLFDAGTQAVQFDFIPGGGSEPPGPGRNAAGLAIFRYRTACGTVFGHTGNTPGYTQFMAASRGGHRSVVVSINRQATPTQAPEVFVRLRNIFRLGVCEALR